MATHAADLPPATVLCTWADELARRHFGTPYDGTVDWAPRLHHRAGDYAPALRRIRLSAPYYRRYGPAEARRILLHELCHWWLHGRGIAHREDSRVFLDLLALVGAPRRGRPLARRERPRRVGVRTAPPRRGRARRSDGRRP
jgi:SprT-like protein